MKESNRMKDAVDIRNKSLVREDKENVRPSLKRLYSTDMILSKKDALKFR